MADNDFYVDDETPEEFEAGWRAGEKGVTKGPKDLNQTAKSIVDRAVAELDQPQEAVHLVVVELKTSAGTASHTSPGGRETDATVTRSVEYQVAASAT